MTVSTDIKSVRYEGNGVTDTFAFNGRIFTTSDLAIDILTRATDAVVETLSLSDYTVSLVSDESAEIIIDAGKIPSASQDVLIYRSIDREQNTRLPTGTVFPAKDVEDALDKVTILVQDVASDVDRVLKFPLNVSGITAANLPAPVDGMLLSWNGETGEIGNTDIADVSGTLDGVFTGLVDGDYIVYDGTNWVNEHKSALPADGIQATSSAGLTLKNSAGTNVLTVGAGVGTGATFAGGVNITGALAGSSTASCVGSLAVAGNASGPASITLAEDTDNGTNKVTLIAPSSLASDVTLTLPSASGDLLTPNSPLFYSTRVTQSTGQAIANGSDTLLLFDTEDFDDGGWHSTSVNTSRITVDYTGRAKVELCLGVGPASRIKMGIYKNGSLVFSGTILGSGGDEWSNMLPYECACTSGDYFEAKAQSNVGGTTTFPLYTSLTVSRTK